LTRNLLTLLALWSLVYM